MIWDFVSTFAMWISFSKLEHSRATSPRNLLGTLETKIPRENKKTLKNPGKTRSDAEK
jgi:hypothetical protein